MHHHEHLQGDRAWGQQWGDGGRKLLGLYPRDTGREFCPSLPCRESGTSFSLVSAGQAQACSRKSSKYLCFSVGQFYGKKVNSFLCLQLFYYAALMKNTLECLKKAYGKELLNGINHFKLSNYPLDFFFFKTPAG